MSTDQRHWLVENRVPAMIVDILETDSTRQFTHCQIVEEVRRFRPDASNNTIRCATLRLARGGQIKRRTYGSEKNAVAYFSLSERVYLNGGFVG